MQISEGRVKAAEMRGGSQKCCTIERRGRDKCASARMRFFCESDAFVMFLNVPGSFSSQHMKVAHTQQF